MLLNTELYKAPPTVTKAKSRPRTIITPESLVAWLEKQPADEPYDSLDPDRCLFAKYLGRRAPQALSVAFGDPLARVAYEEPCIIGAALERARKLT